MKSSSLEVAENDKSRFIDGFQGHEKPSAHWGFSDVTAGAGGVRSTASDMLRYLEAGLNQDVNSKLTPAFNLAIAPQYEMSADTRIGLNWLLTNMNGKTVNWHNGGTGGFASYAGFCREAKVAVVILSNRAPHKPHTDELGMSLMETLISKP
jgi:serine-type D-Ala-D-Ala carboxypeptidase/endopeptidase